MAILVRPNRFERGLRFALPVLLAISVAGCLVLDQLGWSFGGPTFSHKTHVEGEELECIDCHLGYEDKESSGYPRLKACMLCHEDFDEEAEPEARAAAFFEDGKYLVSRVNELDLEISFSHIAHVTDEEGCMECHAEVVGTHEVRPYMAMTMGQCVDCHAEQGEPVACDSCHEEIRVDTKPRSHDGAWGQFHGIDVRNRSELTVDRCDMCHEESACATCHEEVPPANHNNYWRRSSHGLTAQMDRANCATCHTPDYCDRCHTAVEPQSHSGLFGATKNTHCFGCHLSGSSQQSCNLCHVTGAPSHALAPPKPIGHNPASDCRECHLFISHVDNGDDCNACHQ